MLDGSFRISPSKAANFLLPRAVSLQSASECELVGSLSRQVGFLCGAFPGET